MASTPKLECRGISKTYTSRDAEVEVLRNIDLRIEDGEFVTIVGASGCGKTTLLRIVDGLVKPSAGEVRLNGAAVGGPGPDRGFVFQQHGLMPWKTILDNIAFGLELQGIGKRERRETAREFLNLVGLSRFASHYPHELSGGMCQRANLARAITLNPKILLMDEPFAALDAQTREIMQTELQRLREATGKTVMFITHQIDEAVFLGDRVIVMTARPGTVKADLKIGSPRPRTLEVKRDPGFQDVVQDIWTMIEEEVLREMDMSRRGVT